MEHFIFFGLFVAGLYPFLRAWQANRRTTLSHVVVASVAWLGWGLALAFSYQSFRGPGPWHTCIFNTRTGAAGRGVEGAPTARGCLGFVRFPACSGYALLPLGEQLVLGSASLGWLRLFFLAATVAVAIFNFCRQQCGLPDTRRHSRGCIRRLSTKRLSSLVLSPYCHVDLGAADEVSEPHRCGPA